MALIGATTESVARYVAEGQFGLWTDTGRINDAAREAQRDGIGLGEAVGRIIEREKFPYRKESVLAAGVRRNVPVTVHVGIGSRHHPRASQLRRRRAGRRHLHRLPDLLPDAPRGSKAACF